MSDLSLVDGWVPWTVGVLAVVTLVAGLAWRGGPWRRQLVWGVAVSVVGLGTLAAINRVLQLLPFSFPPSFYALAGLVVFAVTVAVVGIRAGGVWRRLDSALAVVATLLLLGAVVNDHYQYYPMLGNLFGKVSEGERTIPELVAIRDEVRRTGDIPTTGYTTHVAIPGTTSGFDARDAYVYLPPAFFADPNPDLPVLMLLHGVPGAPEDWLVAGQADEVADEFAARHDGKAPILVMPDVTGSDFNDTECTDSRRGQVDTYLSTDVPTTVDAVLATLQPTPKWGVAGLSMGGYCALELPLRHPGTFTVFGDYSGLSGPVLDPPESALRDLFDGNQEAMDAYEPSVLLTQRRYEGLSGWFEAGREDSEPLAAVESMAPMAAKAGIDTCLLVRPGGHNFAFWHRALENSLPWMSAKLGLIPFPVDTHGATCSEPS